MVDSQDGGEKSVKIRTYKHPNAVIFKRAIRSELWAWVCADCGYMELYAVNPQALYEAFQEAQREQTESVIVVSR